MAATEVVDKNGYLALLPATARGRMEDVISQKNVRRRRTVLIKKKSLVHPLSTLHVDYSLSSQVKVHFSV